MTGLIHTAEWQDRPVLVTGAGGFIASHLVERLLESGARVRAFVRYNSRNDPGLLRYVAGRGSLPPATVSRLEILAGDLRDPHAVRQAMQGCQTVFHLGALIAIPYSYRHPAEVVETNILGTLNVLQAARETGGLERVVHTSTSEVYGTARRVPIDEAHPLQGQSPYSASKIGADKLAESFHLSYGLPVVTLRPFNTYGPRQSARAVIPTIITQALTQEVIHLGNLEARRDLTYVSDTVEGFMLAGQAPGAIGETINLGSGSEVSIRELAELVLNLLGDRPARIEVEPERLRPERSEVQRLLSDNRRAAEVLGWRPQVDLREGLRRTIEWIRDNLGHYDPRRYQV
jgi:dTDP-glucose 4,6-dehydratase